MFGPAHHPLSSHAPPFPPRSAIREWCLAFHDVRANVLEVVCRWDDLQHMASLPASEQQIMALEALQLFAPLGHALGLGAVSSRIEDLCFKVGRDFGALGDGLLGHDFCSWGEGGS